MNLRNGFTLFEVILYVAIFSVIMYFIGGFAYNLYMDKDRLDALQDINSNGRFLMDTMTQSIEQSTTLETGSTQ
jgi:Tfp pilus assembly protein PilE